MSEELKSIQMPKAPPTPKPSSASASASKQTLASASKQTLASVSTPNPEYSDNYPEKEKKEINWNWVWIGTIIGLVIFRLLRLFLSGE